MVSGGTKRVEKPRDKRKRVFNQEGSKKKQIWRFLSLFLCGYYIFIISDVYFVYISIYMEKLPKNHGH